MDVTDWKFWMIDSYGELLERINAAAVECKQSKRSISLNGVSVAIKI